jgi:hypothetical protein
MKYDLVYFDYEASRLENAWAKRPNPTALITAATLLKISPICSSLTTIVHAEAVDLGR